jgi:hypothetical protein
MNLRTKYTTAQRTLIYFLAALIFAHRAFCAATIRLRPAAESLRRGLTPLLPAAFSARIFAQRARVAAAIRFRPSADIPRVTGDSPNNAKTCSNLEISARTSLAMFSMLNGVSLSQTRRGRIARTGG